nr:SURP and G-patch domain-containing protein 2 [Anolis sagrei ordinatus]
MASRRMTREQFDALAQTKAKPYHFDQSNPIDVALHQLRVQSRPVPRTQYNDEEGDFCGDGKFGSSNWREELRDDYSLPTYRSGSQVAEEDDYYDKSSPLQASRTRDYIQPPSREREYGHSSSAERDYTGLSSRNRNYGLLASHEQDYSHGVLAREPSKRQNASYSSAELLGDFRGSLGALEEAAHGSDYDLDYGIERGLGLSLPIGRGRGTQRKRGMAPRAELGIPAQKWGTKNVALMDNPLAESLKRPLQQTVLSQRPRLFLTPLEKEFRLKPVDPTDIFSTFGIEIIKWAGFDDVRQDSEYSELFRMLFTVETETCAKMLASFKCSLKSEHQRFCLSSVKTLHHLALRAPKVDSQFLSLLLEKKVMVEKNDFFEVIGPFDRYVMRLQNYLLKSATPLLMACNSYELSMKTSSVSKPAQISVALETTVSLCRKALALLGMTFALATAFRQEKILEALSIQEAAPPATSFPNFDTSALFGKEYIEHLKGWLEKSGCQMRLKLPATDVPQESAGNVSETKPKIKIPQRADQKVITTIEKLVDNMVSGLLSEKEKTELGDNPDYWFLQEEESLEHKYYKLKLSEAEQLAAKANSQKEEEEKEKEKVAAAKMREEDALRRVLCAKKIASLKKKLFRGRRSGILQRAARARRARRANVGTQTLLSDKMLKLDPQEAQGPAEEPPSDAAGSSESTASEAPLDPEDTALAGQFPDVDPKTMLTARKLAMFVAEVGPEIEQFSIENSADNPDLWFLQDPESSAFKYYRLKVQQLCSVPSEETEESEGEEPGKAEEEGPATEEEGLATEPEPPTAVPAKGPPFGRKRVSSKTLKVGLIPASKRVCLIDEPKVHDPVRIAYDRPHSYQPNRNKKSAPRDLEFRHKRLNQKNVGFQMLQKMGWKEGLGLGAEGRGITEPIKVGSTSAGQGLGIGDKKEDTFSTFRQRMIKMYYMKRAGK